MKAAIRRYKGFLNYSHPGEHVDVAFLIVRDNEIAFELASVTPEFGRWEAESGVVAKRQPNDTYVAHDVTASAGAHAVKWDLTFRIDHEEVGKVIEISGELKEGAIPYRFRGELDPVT